MLPIPPPCHAQTAASPARTLCRGSTRLPEGWALNSWELAEARLDATLPTPGGLASIRIGGGPDGKIRGWAGARITLAEPRRDRAIPLLAEDRNSGALNILINSGQNRVGSFEGGQPLQINIRVLYDDGTVSPELNYVGIAAYTEGGVIDADPRTWQRVSIPLAAFNASPEVRKRAVGICSVLFQFQTGTPILSGIHLDFIGVGAPTYDAAAEAAAAPPPPADPARFPAFGSLRPPFLTPSNQRFGIGRWGNYTLDCKPRFIIGAEMPEMIHASLAPTAGYPESLRWLYEKPLTYETSQRLGLGAVGYFVPAEWVKRIDPSVYWTLARPGDDAFIVDVIRNLKLPLYVDYTCAPWSHGALYDSAKIPVGAKNVSRPETPGNHQVPYALLNPEGRALHHEMFQAGARQVVAAGGHALFYELFNEPAYDDPSPYNRAAFVARMRGRYTPRTPQTRTGTRRTRRSTRYAISRAGPTTRRCQSSGASSWRMFSWTGAASGCGLFERLTRPTRTSWCRGWGRISTGCCRAQTSTRTSWPRFSRHCRAAPKRVWSGPTPGE